MQETERLDKIKKAMGCGIEPQVIYDQLSAEDRWELRGVFQRAGLEIDWQAVVDDLPAHYRWGHYAELVGQGYHINLGQLVHDRGGYVAKSNRDPCKIVDGCRWMQVDDDQRLALSDPAEWSAIEWLLSKGLPKNQLPEILAPMVVVRNYKSLVSIGVEIDLTAIGRQMSSEELRLSWLWLYTNGAKVSLAGIEGEISAGFLAAHLGAALECSYDADKAVNILSNLRLCRYYNCYLDTGVVAIIDNIETLLAKVSNQAAVVQQAIRRHCSEVGRGYGGNYLVYDRGIDHDDVVGAILASGYDVNEFYGMLPLDDKVRLYPRLVLRDGVAIDLRADILNCARGISYSNRGDLDRVAQLYSKSLESQVAVHASDWLMPLQRMREKLSENRYGVQIEAEEVSRYVRTVLRLCPSVNIYYLVKAIPWSDVVRDNLELLYGHGANPNFLSTRMTSNHVVEKAFQLLAMGTTLNVVIKYAGVAKLISKYGYVVWLKNYGMDANIVVPHIANIVEELPTIAAICNISVAQVVKILLAGGEPGAAKVANNAVSLANSGADINDIAQAMSPLQKYANMPWLLKYDQLDVAFIGNLPPIDALESGAQHDDYLQDSQYRDMDQTWFECLPKLSQRGLASGQLLSKFTAAYLISHRQELREAGYEVSKPVIDGALRGLLSIRQKDCRDGYVQWYKLGDSCTVDALLDIIDAGVDPDLVLHFLPCETLTDDQLCKLVQAGVNQVELFGRLQS